jgi:hypothetical protein
LAQVACGGGHGDVVTMALGTVKHVGDFSAAATAALAEESSYGGGNCHGSGLRSGAAFANPAQDKASPEAARVAAAAEQRMKKRRKKDLRRRARDLRDNGEDAPDPSSSSDDGDEKPPLNADGKGRPQRLPLLPGLPAQLAAGAYGPQRLASTGRAAEGSRVRHPLRDGAGAGTLGGSAVGDASARGLRTLLRASDKRVRNATRSSFPRSWKPPLCKPCHSPSHRPSRLGP